MLIRGGATGKPGHRMHWAEIQAKTSNSRCVRGLSWRDKADVRLPSECPVPSWGQRSGTPAQAARSDKVANGRQVNRTSAADATSNCPIQRNILVRWYSGL
jgi:hypothetical protein